MKKFLSNNPYRILGVPSNSGLRLITKNVSKFKAYSKLGKSINTEYDFSFLNLSVVKRDQTNISKSQNSIINDDDKIKFSLFWFINISPFDSIALSNLVKKDVDKTIEIWRKCVKKSITKNNYSAYNNLSTLLLIKNLIPESNLDSKYANVNDVFNDSQSSSSLAEIKEALSLKYSLLSSDFFNEYKSQLSKGNDSLTNLDFKDFFSQTLLDSLKLNYSNSNLINLFKGLDSDLVASLSSNLIKEPLQDIKNNINSTNAELEKNALKGMILGRELIKSTLKNIKNIKDIAGVESYEYQVITDKLANQILQCGIIYQNKNFDHIEYLSSYEYALSISYSEKTKARAEDFIKHAKDQKTANLCSCCSGSKPVNKSNPYSIRIYKETSRSIWQRSVQYQYIDLTLYYCIDCRKKIALDESVSYKVMGIITVIGMIFGIASNGAEGLIFGLIGGFVLGAIIANMATSTSSDVYNNPIVKKYNIEGWGFSKPSA